MSTILSDDFEEVVVKRRRKVLGITCDICKKPLPLHPTAKYYRVTTGHHDWGNDSCDSIEHYDICPECIVQFVSDYVNDVNSDESNTKWMEIQTEIGLKGEKVYE